METRVHRNEEIGGRNDMSISFDLATGQVLVSGTGFWSVPQALAYFADWRFAVSAVHRAGHALSSLVDLSEAGVQKAAVADIIAGVTSEIYRPGDSIAMLVPNCLAKMQMRRVLDARYHNFFVSKHAAEMWLNSRSQKLWATAV